MKSGRKYCPLTKGCRSVECAILSVILWLLPCPRPAHSQTGRGQVFVGSSLTKCPLEQNRLTSGHSPLSDTPIWSRAGDTSADSVTRVVRRVRWGERRRRGQSLSVIRRWVGHRSRWWSPMVDGLQIQSNPTFVSPAKEDTLALSAHHHIHHRTTYQRRCSLSTLTNRPTPSVSRAQWDQCSLF